MTPNPDTAPKDDAALEPHFRLRRRLLAVSTIGVGLLFVAVGLVLRTGLPDWVAAHMVLEPLGPDVMRKAAAGLVDGFTTSGMSLIAAFSAMWITPPVRRWLGYAAQLDERDEHVIAQSAHWVLGYSWVVMMFAAVVLYTLHQVVAAYAVGGIYLASMIANDALVAYLYRRH